MDTILEDLAELLEPDEFALIADSVKESRASRNLHHEYGGGVGDVGSNKPFLEYKFGAYRRLNPPVWEYLLPGHRMAQDAKGVKLQFAREYVGTFAVKNVYLQP